MFRRPRRCHVKATTLPSGGAERGITGKGCPPQRNDCPGFICRSCFAVRAGRCAGESGQASIRLQSQDKATASKESWSTNSAPPCRSAIQRQSAARGRAGRRRARDIQSNEPLEHPLAVGEGMPGPVSTTVTVAAALSLSSPWRRLRLGGARRRCRGDWSPIDAASLRRPESRRRADVGRDSMSRATATTVAAIHSATISSTSGRLISGYPSASARARTSMSSTIRVRRACWYNGQSLPILSFSRVSRPSVTSAAVLITDTGVRSSATSAMNERCIRRTVRAARAVG